MLALMALVASPAEAHHARPYHWKHPEIRVVDSTDSGWSGHVRKAARTWSRGPLELIVRRRGSDCGPKRGRIHICDVDGLEPNTYAGVAYRTRPKRKHFRSPYILLNNEPDYSMLRRAVACHEIGHTLGLGHSSDKGSCMHAFPRSPWPNRHDRHSSASTPIPRRSGLVGHAEPKRIEGS